MSVAPLLDAVLALHRALRAPDIVGGNDGPIAIELPFPAGLRFERWFSSNYHPAGPFGTLRTVDGVAPWREVDLGPVRIKWPLKLVALPSGAIVPEPIEQRYVPGT